jgi:IclR family transcriptional regulator, KDG regulon repressor
MRNQATVEIKSLAKAVDVLDLFAGAQRELTFSEVVAETGMSKATAHRFLAVLTELGLLRRTGGQATFALGFRLIELGAAAASQIDLQTELRPFLRGLTERTRETSNLAVLAGRDVVVIDQVPSPDEFRLFARVGRSVPAATSSLGKVLFAHADESTRSALLDDVELAPRTPNSIVTLAGLTQELALVREQGFALDREENRVGVVCVGAPVYDLSGEVVAAISTSGPSARMAGERLEEAIATVCEIAGDASRTLGCTTTPEPAST